MSSHPPTVPLSSRPSGADLRCELANAARKAGVTLSAFVRPLTDFSLAWLNELERRDRPTLATIERVRALIDGREVLASPPANLDVAALRPVRAISFEQAIAVAVKRPAMDDGEVSDVDIQRRRAELGVACDALLRAELRYHLAHDTLPPHFDASRFYALCDERGLVAAR